MPEKGGKVLADIENDILKMAIINRYAPNVKPAIALVKNFGLIDGAIGSSVAHDSHNIIVVGTSDNLMAEAGFSVASSYIEVDKQAKKLGSGLKSPFMTLSFMGLLVIPHLKLSDKGLFNSDLFKFIKVFG